MRMFSAILALAISAAAPAVAQTVPDTANETPLVPVEAVASQPHIEPQALSIEMLAAENGQGVSNTVMSDQQLSATSSGNSLTAGTSIHTGDVSFSTTALNGFSGVGNFVVNTGNNSNLQGTINVNIVTNGPMQ